MREIAQHSKILAEKINFLLLKRNSTAMWKTRSKKKKTENTKRKKIDALLEEMQDEAEQMAFQEFAFMKDELCEKLDEP